ncbi:MAG: 2-hydroxyacid dehydrogenase [Synergistaceae bacterium]|jgi:phosphoglycerate dehydrogenase-like enzyme|nr:2-hydroxyacid dehydrogenase [Synergistaceae bacterium]
MKVLFYSKELSKRREKLIARMPEYDVDTAGEEDAREKIPGADVLVSHPGAAVSGELLRAAPTLKLLHQWGVGLDNIDFGVCRELGIAVCNTPSRGTGNAESVAEIALLHMLLLARKYAFAQENARAGKFFSPRGTALWQKRVCVVGLGDLGRTIAERLAALGMTVRGVNRSPIEGGRLDGMGVKEFFPLKRLREAAAGCRFVVVSVALGDETRGLFDDAFFQSMDEGAFFITVARGALVQDDALLRALDSKRLAGAGLDVLTDEPPRPGSPLLTHPSVTLTPHFGGITDAAEIGIFEFIRGNIGRLSRGEPLLSRRD